MMHGSCEKHSCNQQKLWFSILLNLHSPPEFLLQKNYCWYEFFRSWFIPCMDWSNIAVLQMRTFVFVGSVHLIMCAGVELKIAIFAMNFLLHKTVLKMIIVIQWLWLCSLIIPWRSFHWCFTSSIWFCSALQILSSVCVVGVQCCFQLSCSHITTVTMTESSLLNFIELSHWSIITVYQRTLDIAIREAWVFL